MLSTSIEIAAPPAKVREVMLDFPNYSQWHTGFFGLIKPTTGGEDSLAVGNQMKGILGGNEYLITITRNDESGLQWQGPPIMGIIQGLHGFRFEPSATSPGWTTFIQDEEFSGVGWFLMNEYLMGGWLVKEFEKFNQDIKARAEQTSG